MKDTTDNFLSEWRDRIKKMGTIKDNITLLFEGKNYLYSDVMDYETFCKQNNIKYSKREDISEDKNLQMFVIMQEMTQNPKYDIHRIKEKK